MTAVTDTIGALVEPLVTAGGLELWDVEQSAGAIRILVDRPGGVDLDQLGALAATISDALDAHRELQPEAGFQLEVSSPGVERTLRTPAQYRRFVGAPIAVKTSESIDGARRFQGILESADDGGIRLGPDGTSAALELSYRQIQKAHTVFVWGPAPKPGNKSGRVTAGSASGAGVGRAAAGRPNPPSMKDTAP